MTALTATLTCRWYQDVRNPGFKTVMARVRTDMKRTVAAAKTDLDNPANLDGIIGCGCLMAAGCGKGFVLTTTQVKNIYLHFCNIIAHTRGGCAVDRCKLH